MVKMESDDAARIRKLRRRVNAARNFPFNTCSASRHLNMMAEDLLTYGTYPLLQEEPAHCAETMLGVLESLWKLRTQVEKMRQKIK